MTWVRLDDNFPDHPKIERLSNEAYRLFVDALCHCGRYRTDGRIQGTAVARLTAGKMRRPQKIVAELVDAGLWIADLEDGYVVSGYLKYQPSAAEIAERSAKRAEAGRIGASRRWQSA
jgi:hypothetical protein